MRKFLLVFVFIFLFPRGVKAADDFQTKYVVNYKFDAHGQSQITQNVKLTNLRSEVYATEYQFTIPNSVSPNITGTDSSGPLRITTQAKGDDSTLVTVAFNNQAVGKGKFEEFTLNYKGPNATHNGQIWEVVLPGIGNSDFIDDYILNLQIPSEFGKLAFITPQPISSSEYNYTFTKNQLAKVGVVAAFGNFQTFGFEFKYNLENSQNKPVYTEVALPPDTNYQRVFYDNIVPRPINVRQDEDGNWLARYDLKPNEKINIVANGQVHLLAEPVKLFSDLVGKPNLNKYLQSTPYWPVSDPEMTKLGRQLQTPKAIYDYVVDKLSYDLAETQNPSRTRKGALLALQNPTNSVCMEFTDLFITLARAAGIPAREINGYAYTNDQSLRPLSLAQDVLHAWPQYWDFGKSMWISIDPTWGNTTGGVDYFSKLDFSHFTFAIHGESDSEPIAVGLYKSSENGKNVNVFFTNYKEYPQKDLDVTWNKPWQIFPIVDTRSSFTLTNNQGQAIYHRDINIEPKNFALTSSPFVQVVVLPPFSHLDLPLVMQRGRYFSFKPQSFEISFNNQEVTYNVDSRLYLAWHVGVGIIASLIIIGLAIVAGSTGSLYFQKFRPGNNLRGQGKDPPQ